MYPKVFSIFHISRLNVVISIVESACDVAIVKFPGDLSRIQKLKIIESKSKTVALLSLINNKKLSCSGFSKTTETKTEKLEREYTIPLRRRYQHVPRYKRTSKNN